MAPYELPNGWDWKELGDVVSDVQPGFACGRKSKTDGIPHLRMNNISSHGTLDISSIWRVSIDSLQKEKYTLFKGDVLFTNTNSPKLVGRSALFNLDGEYVFSNHLTRLRLNGNVYPNWLALFLHWLWMIGYFESICKQWVNQAAVSKTKLLKTEIPIPPMAEQQRIVARMEEIINRIKRAREFQKEAITKANTILPAVIAEVMSRAELEGWGCKRVGDKEYFDLIMGQSPPSRTYNLNGDDLPFFQGKAEFGDIHPIAKKYCSSPTRVALKNDVLISVRAPVGPTNLADKDCCIGRGLAAIRCKEKVLPLYLLYALRNIESGIAATVKDQGGGFTAIKRNQLAAVEIPIPPLSEQRRIVLRIKEITHHVNELKHQQEAMLAELNKMIPSVLSRAFRGELRVQVDLRGKPAINNGNSTFYREARIKK